MIKHRGLKAIPIFLTKTLFIGLNTEPFSDTDFACFFRLTHIVSSTFSSPQEDVRNRGRSDGRCSRCCAVKQFPASPAGGCTGNVGLCFSFNRHISVLPFLFASRCFSQSHRGTTDFIMALALYHCIIHLFFYNSRVRGSLPAPRLATNPVAHPTPYLRGAN